MNSKITNYYNFISKNTTLLNKIICKELACKNQIISSFLPKNNTDETKILKTIKQSLYFNEKNFFKKRELLLTLFALLKDEIPNKEDENSSSYINKKIDYPNYMKNNVYEKSDLKIINNNFFEIYLPPFISKNRNKNLGIECKYLEKLFLEQLNKVPKDIFFYPKTTVVFTYVYKEIPKVFDRYSCDIDNFYNNFILKYLPKNDLSLHYEPMKGELFMTVISIMNSNYYPTFACKK